MVYARKLTQWTEYFIEDDLEDNFWLTKLQVFEKIFYKMLIFILATYLNNNKEISFKGFRGKHYVLRHFILKVLLSLSMQPSTCALIRASEDTAMHDYGLVI